METNIFEKLETYKDLFDNAHDLIHLVAPDGRVIYVNQAWQSILGYSQNEVQGQSIYSIVHQDDRQRFISYRESALSQQPVAKEILVRFVSKDRRVVHVEGFVSPKIVDGKPAYSRGIFRDVTAKLKNERELILMNEELKQREANLRQLLFYAPDAVIVIDSQSRIDYWNPKAESIFGWSASEVAGRSLTELIIPPQFREAHERGMKRFLATGEAVVLNRTIEISAIDKAGREFFVSLTISTTSQKGKAAFIAFIRDIDEQKRNALELEQKRLQLEISNRELEQFAHVASHDMKEPVRKINIFIDRLDSEAGEGLSLKAREYLSKIRRATSRLTQMVDGVLAYSSLKAEDLVIEKVDLNVIIENVESDFELILHEKGGVIRHDTLPVVEGAGFLLYQLFYNLINNALKFSRAGVRPVITITSGRPENAGLPDPRLPYVQISVMDNGIGFPQALSTEIFNTFSRLHSKDQYEGTGLGLSLCRNIVEKHKGMIAAVGKENEGATFIITIPERQISP